MSYIHLDGCNGVEVSGLQISERLFAGVRVQVEVDDCTAVNITDFILRLGRREAILVTDSQQVRISDGIVDRPGRDTTNTYDGIYIDADLCEVQDVTVIAASTGNVPRYGINIAGGSDNIYVSNSAQGTFGTAAYNDGGTGTLNTYPGASAPQGDNFIV